MQYRPPLSLLPEAHRVLHSTMLKPFQIRDLQGSPLRDQEGDSDGSRGVVRISAIDYDDLASNHPRARLSYLDDDDGDKIEVRYNYP